MAEKVTLGLIVMIALDLMDILLFQHSTLLQQAPETARTNYDNNNELPCHQRQRDAKFASQSPHNQQQNDDSPETPARGRWSSFRPILFAQAKGVAGLGKAGGDGQGGSDKAGQQVPPEVYNALTYAGTAFLFTLSVPLILYGLNKLFNRIQDCFGCGPSSRRKALEARKLKKQQSFEQPSNQQQQKQKQQQLPKQSQYHHQQQHNTKLQSQILDPSSLMMMGKVQNNGNSNNITTSCNSNNSNGNNITTSTPSPSLLANQQQQSTLANSPNFNLPSDFEFNHKSTHHEHRQPYIISSPHL